MSCRKDYEPCDCQGCMDNAQTEQREQSQEDDREYIAYQCGSVGHPFGGMAIGKALCHCGEREFNGLELAKEIAAREKRTSTKDIT